jgi:hypothetical protein
VSLRRLRPVALLLGLAVATTRSAAAAGDAAPAPSSPDSSAAVTPPHLPSPNVAALLSTLAVAVPLIASTQVAKDADSETRNRAQIALVATAIVVGPVVGYVYGGCEQRGFAGLGLRAAGAGVIAALAVSASSAGEGGATAIFPAGIVAAVVVGSAIWDMATVDDKVAKRNRTVTVSLRSGTAPFSGAPALVLDLRR